MNVHKDSPIGKILEVYSILRQFSCPNSFLKRYIQGHTSVTMYQSIEFKMVLNFDLKLQKDVKKIFFNVFCNLIFLLKNYCSFIYNPQYLFLVKQLSPLPFVTPSPTDGFGNFLYYITLHTYYGDWSSQKQSVGFLQIGVIRSSQDIFPTF